MSRTPQFKYCGISVEQIKDLRTYTSKNGFVDHDYGMVALSGICVVTGGAGSIAQMASQGTRLQRGADTVGG